jgi:hypothetical protein
MLARHTAGGETERLADFSEARRLTVLGDAISDKGQDGGTAGSQSRHGVHLYSFGFFLARAVSHLPDSSLPHSRPTVRRLFFKKTGSKKIKTIEKIEIAHCSYRNILPNIEDHFCLPKTKPQFQKGISQFTLKSANTTINQDS